MRRPLWEDSRHFHQESSEDKGREPRPPHRASRDKAPPRGVPMRSRDDAEPRVPPMAQATLGREARPPMLSAFSPPDVRRGARSALPPTNPGLASMAIPLGGRDTPSSVSSGYAPSAGRLQAPLGFEDKVVPPSRVAVGAREFTDHHGTHCGSSVDHSPPSGIPPASGHNTAHIRTVERDRGCSHSSQLFNEVVKASQVPRFSGRHQDFEEFERGWRPG